jgi:hypothetical protein
MKSLSAECREVRTSMLIEQASLMVDFHDDGVFDAAVGAVGRSFGN